MHAGWHQAADAEYNYPGDFSVLFLGKSFNPVDSARDLGVITDSYLTYDSHISSSVSSYLSKLVEIN